MLLGSNEAAWCEDGALGSEECSMVNGFIVC